jgi:hypothetical protein
LDLSTLLFEQYGQPLPSVLLQTAASHECPNWHFHQAFLLLPAVTFVNRSTNASASGGNVNRTTNANVSGANYNRSTTVNATGGTYNRNATVNATGGTYNRSAAAVGYGAPAGVYGETVNRVYSPTVYNGYSAAGTPDLTAARAVVRHDR